MMRSGVHLFSVASNAQVRRGQQGTVHKYHAIVVDHLVKVFCPIVVYHVKTLRVLQLKFQSMSKDDMAAIAEAQTKGDMSILYKHPRLKSIARQGVINIKIKSVDRLIAPAKWRGTHKHV